MRGDVKQSHHNELSDLSSGSVSEKQVKQLQGQPTQAKATYLITDEPQHHPLQLGKAD